MANMLKCLNKVYYIHFLGVFVNYQGYEHIYLCLKSIFYKFHSLGNLLSFSLHELHSIIDRIFTTYNKIKLNWENQTNGPCLCFSLSIWRNTWTEAVVCWWWSGRVGKEVLTRISTFYWRSMALWSTMVGLGVIITCISQLMTINKFKN